MSNNFVLKVGVKIDDAQVRQQFATLSKKSVISTVAKFDGKEAIKTVTTYEGKLGKLYTTTKYATLSGDTLSNTLTQVKENFKNNTKAVEDTKGALSGLGSEMVTTIGKVLKFAAATAVIMAFKQAVSEAVEIIHNFDDSLTELNKVTDFTDKQLKSLISDLGEVGKTVARTTTEMVDAATEFAKSGNYSESQLVALSKTATMYQNIADSELSAGDAASYIISQMKAFNISAEDSMQIIDKTNEVSNNFAVSSTDISSALTKTSSSLAAYGNTIDDTIALITAGTEIMTHQAGKVGRGLRSIGANIANLASSAGELSFQVNGATETISLLNKETGDMLSTRAVLEEISKSWEKMTNEEKAALAIQLSGKTQIDVFTSVLSNFDTVIKASETSMNSFGSAERENEKVMESLTAKINQMKTEFESLVLGTDGRELLKNLADIITNILKIINTLGGLKTILVAIGGILITLNINKITLNISYLLGNLSKLKDGVVTFFKSLKDIKGIFSTIKGSLGQYGAAMQVATMNTEGLALAEEAVAAEGAAAASAIQGVIGVAALLVVGTMAVVSAIKQQREEQERAHKERIESINSEIKANDDLLKSLKNEQLTKEQLISLVTGQLSNAYVEELKGITNVNDAREKAIDLIKKEQKEKANELVLTGKQDYESAIDEMTQTYYAPILSDIYKGGDAKAAMTKLLGDKQFGEFSGLYEYKEWLEEIIPIVQDGLDSVEKGSKEYIYYDRALSMYSSSLAEVNSKISENTTTISQYNAALRVLGKSVEYETQEEKDADEARKKALETVADAYGISIEKAEELQALAEENGTTFEEEAEKAGYVTKALEGSVEAINNAESAFKDAMSAIDDFSSSYQTLSSAVDEYNSSGELSLSTIDNLLKLSNDYLSALQFQDGQLHLNEESLSKIANARIDEAEAMAVQEAQAQLAAIAEGNYNQTLAESSSASSIAQIAAQAAGASIKASAEDALVAAESWATAWEAIANGYVKIDANNWGQVKQVEESLKTRLGTIEQLRGNLGKFTSATKGNTKATRDNTKAVDENTEALKKKKEAQQEVVDGLEDEIDEYERVIKYIQGKLKDEIDALKDARDAEVDKINEKIDSLEKLKDAEDKYWEDRISELRAANDELEKGIELEQLEEALAKAKSQKVKVYKDGKFVWDTNSEAVSKATDDIAAFKRKKAYEDQLAELEHFREQSKDKYDAQIRDYEEHIQKIKDGYDKQIAALQKYLDRFNLGIKKYEKEQDRLLALQKTGIDFESNNWKNRLKNLDGFVKKYTNKLKSLKKEQKELNKISKELSKLQSNTNTNNSGGGGDNSGGGNDGSIDGGRKYTPPKIEKPYTVFKILGEYKTSGEATSKIAPLSGEGVIKYKDKYVVYRKVGIFGDSLTASARATGLTVASKGKSKYGFKQFANGTPYVDKDQIALVGENPNKELVIGSKINNGVMMKLNQGTGVVNAQSTNTLAKMLNSINPNRSFNMADNTKEVSQTFNFDSIVLPNVTNGDEFANEISTKFSQYVRQYKLKF